MVRLKVVITPNKNSGLNILDGSNIYFTPYSKLHNDNAILRKSELICQTIPISLSCQSLILFWMFDSALAISLLVDVLNFGTLLLDPCIWFKFTSIGIKYRLICTRGVAISPARVARLFPPPPRRRRDPPALGPGQSASTLWLRPNIQDFIPIRYPESGSEHS